MSELNGQLNELTLSDEIFDMKSSGGVPNTSIIKFNCCISANRVGHCSFKDFPLEFRA